MLLLAAAVALSAPALETPPSSTVVTAQARASVRIISAVTLRLGEGALSGDAPPARDTIVHPGGIAQAANLIEFE